MEIAISRVTLYCGSRFSVTSLSAQMDFTIVKGLRYKGKKALKNSLPHISLSLSLSLCPEISVKCLPGPLCGTRSSLSQLAWLVTSHRDLCAPLSLPCAEITDHSIQLLCRSRDLNSGPHVCIANTLPTEPSFQFQNWVILQYYSFSPLK